MAVRHIAARHDKVWFGIAPEHIFDHPIAFNSGIDARIKTRIIPLPQPATGGHRGAVERVLGSSDLLDRGEK